MRSQRRFQSRGERLSGSLHSAVVFAWWSALVICLGQTFLPMQSPFLSSPPPFTQFAHATSFPDVGERENPPCTVDGISNAVQRESARFSAYFQEIRTRVSFIADAFRGAEERAAYSRRYTLDTIDIHEFGNGDTASGYISDADRPYDVHIPFRNQTAPDYDCVAELYSATGRDLGNTAKVDRLTLVSIPGGCILPYPEKLTELCALPPLSNYCPDPQVAWDTPFNKIGFVNESCPSFCLDPQRFNNSIDQFFLDFSDKLPDFTQSVNSSLHNTIVSWGVALEKGSFATWTNLYMEDPANRNVFEDFLPFLGSYTPYAAVPSSFVTFSEEFNPDAQPHWLRPAQAYLDQGGIYSNNMQLCFPVVIGEYRLANVFFSIRLEPTSSTELPTPDLPQGAFTVLAELETDNILFGDQEAYDKIFCPGHHLCANNNSTLDLQHLFSLNEPLPRLSESFNGFGNLTEHLRNLNVFEEWRAGSLRFTLQGTEHVVSYSPLDLGYGYQLLLMFVVPSTILDEGTLWESDTLSLVVPYDGDRIEVGSEEALHSITLTNKGLYNLTWSADSTWDVPIVPLSGSLTPNESVTLTLNTSLLIQDGPDVEPGVLRITPDPLNGGGACFSLISIPLSVLDVRSDGSSGISQSAFLWAVGGSITFLLIIFCAFGVALRIREARASVVRSEMMMNQEKTFVAYTFHELRNPLNGVVCFLEEARMALNEILGDNPGDGERLPSARILQRSVRYDHSTNKRGSVIAPSPSLPSTSPDRQRSSGEEEEEETNVGIESSLHSIPNPAEESKELEDRYGVRPGKREVIDVNDTHGSGDSSTSVTSSRSSLSLSPSMLDLQLGIVKEKAKAGLLTEDVLKKLQLVREDLDRSSLCTSHAMEVLHNVVDMADLAQGTLKLDIQPVDIDEVCYMVLAMQGMENPAVELQSDLTKNCSYILSDFHRLKQILLNLLANARLSTVSGYIRLRTSIVDVSKGSDRLIAQRIGSQSVCSATVGLGSAGTRSSPRSGAKCSSVGSGGVSTRGSERERKGQEEDSNNTLQTTPPDRITIKFEVMDTGNGIPKQLQDSFAPGTKPSLMIGPHLNVLMADNLVTAMGGTLEFESPWPAVDPLLEREEYEGQVGGIGSHFWFSLTFDVHDEEDQEEEERQTLAAKKQQQQQQQQHSYQHTDIELSEMNRTPSKTSLSSTSSRTALLSSGGSKRNSNRAVSGIGRGQDGGCGGDANHDRCMLPPCIENKEVVIPLFENNTPEQSRNSCSLSLDPSRMCESMNSWSVLVVDDVKLNRSILRRRFTGHVPFSSLNWTVKEALNGEEALSLLCSREHRFDVVTMDENMLLTNGVLKGSEVVKLYREWERKQPDVISKKRKKTIIVSVSGNVSESDRQHYLSSGVDLVWGKPIPKADSMASEIYSVLSTSLTTQAKGVKNRGM